MHKFSEFDLRLNIARLPLTYSLGDLSSIREIFTPEPGDIGRTQLPILPPKIESISLNGEETHGYLVETSSVLFVAIKEFLKSLVFMFEHKDDPQYNHSSETASHYVEVRRECMNRIGTRLLEVIKQERRLGLYNLFWLVISKHIAASLEQAITKQGRKQQQLKIAMHPIIAQALEETLQKVRLHFRKEDKKRRRYSHHIHETITSHLGATFNYEFSRSIITDQIHSLAPNISRANLLECAQSVFVENNEKYHMTYSDFAEIYSGVRSYITKRLHKGDPVFREMIANVLRIPPQTVENVPIETLVFHPTIISLFAEEIKGLPAKGSSRKKTLFKSWSPQLGDIIGEDVWEFALNDYLTFAKDLRRSEIIAFLRNRIAFVTKTQETSVGGLGRGRKEKRLSSGIADKTSYQFDKGRIINDLRSVTLIFLDLRGFTELSAGDITDQELKEQLYHFFDPVVNIINQFGGTIKYYAGDGILAAFGTNSWQKNHALDAIRAALEIQKFFNILKQKEKMAFKGLGIGIHTGLVEEAYFFPDLESPNYNTVIGLTANLVGRLSSGKAAETKKHDLQAVFSLCHDLLSSSNQDPLILVNLENQVLQALEALEQEQVQPGGKQKPQHALTVKVAQGVLNNQGIAISGVANGTFDKLRESVELKEIEFQDSVQYTFFDDVLHEQLVFIKAGDASFKGIDTGARGGKFPVWGVYLERELH